MQAQTDLKCDFRRLPLNSLPIYLVHDRRPRDILRASPRLRSGPAWSAPAVLR